MEEDLSLPQGDMEWESALLMAGMKVFLPFPKHLYKEQPLRQAESLWKVQIIGE